MALVTLQDVSITFGARRILDAVSLTIRAGDRIGLLGANGSGKSTLTRILAGLEPPDAGQRTIQRGLQIGYLEQDPQYAEDADIRSIVAGGIAGRADVQRQIEALHESLASAGTDEIDSLLARQAALENKLEALGGHDVSHRIEAMIEHLGIQDGSARFSSLSGGERRRTALARLLLQEPDLLILDEPTNHLDAAVTDWLEDYMLQSRTPLVLVTHDRYFLDRLVRRTIELEGGRLHEYDGGYAEFLAARAARLERAGAAESTRANLLRRETEWMRRGPPARTTKSKARIDRYQQLVDAAPPAAGRDLSFSIPSGPRLGERVIELRGLRAGYGERILLSGLDLEIGARTRIGIVGPNGAGKSTLLKTLTGELPPLGGTVQRGSTVKFAGIDQSRVGLDPDKTVLDEVSGSNDYVHIDGNAIRIETFLEQFLFPGAMKHTKVATLSGGERGRVLLAKLLCADGNVLLLDEPTNDLDLMTLRVLEEALCAFPGVVIAVSHDRYFLDRIATHILSLDGHGGHHFHVGDLSSLLEKAAARRAPSASAEAARAKGKRDGDGTRKRRLSTREANELEKLPDQIAAAELLLAKFDQQLEDPELWQGKGEDPHVLLATRNAQQRSIEDLYARWQELETVRDEQ